MKLPIRNESAKNSQEGFSVVEVFLLVLVIIFLGITGGVVYHYNHKSTDSTTNNQSSSTSPNVINQPIDILYPSLPSGLQSAILAEYKQQAPGCVSNGQFVDPSGQLFVPDAWYMSSGYAEAGIGCDSPAATLFVDVSGKWQSVASTQDVYLCSTLDQYKIPESLLSTSGPSPVKCATSYGLGSTTVLYTN